MERSRGFFFFFNDTATTEIYTLSLHDALPILSYGELDGASDGFAAWLAARGVVKGDRVALIMRSEEHTSELQSRSDLVCRLLLEKKKRQTTSSASRVDSPEVHALRRPFQFMSI